VTAATASPLEQSRTEAESHGVLMLLRVVPQAQPTADLRTTYDAVVVGSGAAGGMAAHVL